jgi:asparagine synthase (glutamine-hydrolysing)
MEFAAALPVDLKLGSSGGKLILKSALRGVLPDEILDRSKMGFAVPLGGWLRDRLSGLAGEQLLDSGALTGSYLDRGVVERLISEHRERVADHSMRLWVLMMLETWHHEVLEAAPSQRGRDAEHQSAPAIE